MKALPLTDKFFFFPPDQEVFVTLSSGASETVLITSLKRMKLHAVISFCDVTCPEAAAKYRGSMISAVNALLPPLRKHEYYYEQIIGLSVITTEGTLVGTVSEIFETGSNDVYVVTGPEREYLIPAISDVVREIQLKHRRIIIQVINGLLD